MKTQWRREIAGSDVSPPCRLSVLSNESQANLDLLEGGYEDLKHQAYDTGSVKAFSRLSLCGSRCKVH